ncbi:MAG: hypothetical protein K0B81_04105 [Candidatus Cloacimonetes bacterium]|nr:hypothetical protein [Candidatus Cloacimonadota bacterium]
MKKIIRNLMIFALLVMFSITLKANNPSSENFILKAHALSSGSASSNAPSSANYILQGSVFGIITGDEATSANYNLLPGYYLGIDETGELLQPTNVLIWITGGTLYLEWDEVIGANSYKIYGSDDPYLDNWGSEIAVVGLPEYSEPVSQTRKFYRIVASTDIAPTRGESDELRRRASE